MKVLGARVAGWHGCSDPWVAWVEPEHSEGRDSGKNPVLCQRPSHELCAGKISIRVRMNTHVMYTHI